MNCYELLQLAASVELPQGSSILLICVRRYVRLFRMVSCMPTEGPNIAQFASMSTCAYFALLAPPHFCKLSDDMDCAGGIKQEGLQAWALRRPFLHHHLVQDDDTCWISLPIILQVQNKIRQCRVLLAQHKDIPSTRAVRVCLN